jgi:thioesterase domain-containing protein
MTFAGKKLQDIYDSGSTRLSELEENSQSKLATKSEAHISERKESEQQSKMEVAAKAASVEEEIKKQAKETAERIKQVADTEKAATQAHLNTMIERLSSFTSELKRAIEDLKTSYETGLEDNFVRAADHYSSGAEGVCQEIEDQHYQSGQKLRSQSSFYANSLQQKLDHSLWNLGAAKSSQTVSFPQLYAKGKQRREPL